LQGGGRGDRGLGGDEGTGDEWMDEVETEVIGVGELRGLDRIRLGWDVIVVIG
jgi:hypothetical protein